MFGLYDGDMLTRAPTRLLSNAGPLFGAMAGLDGCLHAALEGTMGQVLVDDPDQPSVALVELDFWFLGGNPDTKGVDEVVRSVDLPASFVIAGPGWEGLLRRIWGTALQEHTRVAFSPGNWNLDILRKLSADLPDGLKVSKVDASNVVQFEELAESLVYNFDSLDDFIERGVGFGIEYDGQFVSGCSSFAISSHSLEFEIQTHPEFRRRGFASATAAAMILYCLEAGLEPCWDAHNEMSAALATKIGFAEPRPYTAYELPGNAKPA